jgi:hypothetical protein
VVQTTFVPDSFAMMENRHAKYESISDVARDVFLIGLLTGFAETHFANMRMGLAAHLEGVMNGTFPVALGAAWL